MLRKRFLPRLIACTVVFTLCAHVSAATAPDGSESSAAYETKSDKALDHLLPIQIAIGSGYSLPVGKVYDSSLSNVADAQVPLRIDAGLRLGGVLYLGLVGSLAWGGVGDAYSQVCERSGAECSALSTRVGFAAQYYVSAKNRFVPWFGVGSGYEWLQLKAKAPGLAAVESEIHGVEFAHFNAGLDARLSWKFWVGPVLDFGVGAYTSSDGDRIFGVADGDARLHGWLTLGARVVALP